MLDLGIELGTEMSKYEMVYVPHRVLNLLSSQQSSAMVPELFEMSVCR